MALGARAHGGTGEEGGVDGRAVEGADDRAIFERLERSGGSTVLTVERDDHVRMLALIPGE